MSEHAYIESKPKFSVIWFVPIIALCVTIWMLYQHQLNKGHTVFVKMSNADGIIAGKTQVRVRSVKIGQVESLRLQLDQNAVIAKVQIDTMYEPLLTSDAKIWVVKPRIDESGISGMNTLLSGVYLELEPGTSKVKSSLFTLQDEPALIGTDIEGKRYKLKSKHAEVLDVGTGIYFRNFKIGQIESANFNIDNLAMEYGVFIFSPYDQLITNNMIFWVASGVSINLSTEGIDVSTGSLSKLIKGGISVDYPPDQAPSEIAQEQVSFTLHENFSTALEQRFDDYDFYLIEFEQSIRGLRAGAPVEYRGMRIGTVEQAPAQLKRNGQPLYFQQDSTSIPVLIRIEYGRLFERSAIAREYWQQHIEKWIRNGLRASLKSGNMLTGAIYIELDFYPDAPDARVMTSSLYPTLPSVSSGFTALSEQVTKLLNKLNDLPVNKTLDQLDGTLREYRQLAMEMNELIGSFNQSGTTNKVNENLDTIKVTLTQLTSSLRQFEKTLTHYQQDSTMVEQLTDTLEELESLSNTLKPFAKGLNEQPNMIIFNKQTPDDPEPRKK
ncbi:MULTISPECIES: intermembrane transport protein PqiB [Pseudoalteromonas]|uniref:Mammalian cell entry protein n=1 Tax=Pseudoalteromonas amylolytica TaxID=1859457 RepID=A0A1S1MVW3_9GAMM|nr:MULTISPECIES: intermembrane transport protein PqiB [Pseudoalteromonas]MCF6434318.1 intermembrane transport protein PqiB [Pseudoalteromonas sp. MMG022]OHU85362.1 mammalian cell entry protein [Pseudoalteromonas sp. JW3]OHU93017.1 mammalian cell entry protein [Pseudoalteromonas amylolytica]